MRANHSNAVRVIQLHGQNGLNGAPEPTPEPEKPSVEDYFDFNTMQTIKVNIDYGFNDYLVLFELFDENPTEEPEDGSIIKKRI